jgi:predicted GNAT family acetyltransferase
MPNIGPLVKAGAKGVDYLVDALRSYKAPGMVNAVESVAPRQISDVSEIAAKYPDVILDLYNTKDKLNLSRIVVPKELRNQGVGKQVMSDITQYADQAGKQVVLSPSADFGGNVNRLKEFYKEFGFIENKGRNKDFSTMESMYRNPSNLGN